MGTPLLFMSPVTFCRESEASPLTPCLPSTMCPSLPQVPVPHFLCHLVPFNKRNGITFPSEDLGAFQVLGKLEAVTIASSLPSLAGTLELEAPLWGLGWPAPAAQQG